jgi:3-hydroxy-3-methylglutaryl CoA synthase
LEDDSAEPAFYIDEEELARHRKDLAAMLKRLKIIHSMRFNDDDEEAEISTLSVESSSRRSKASKTSK